MRILLATGILLIASAAAEASHTRASAGVPTGGRLTHRTFEVVDETHSTLTFTLSTNSRRGREVSVPIQVPDGMIATGLTLSIGGHETLTGFAYERSSARATYNTIVRQIEDPALLEWAGEGRLQLSVFPVASGAPARVTITLTAIDEASIYTQVNGQISIVAAPGLGREDPYAEYWPAHPSPTTEVATLQ